MQLYDYQKDGVAFLTKRIPEMKYKPHAVLAFDTGLGKTDIGVNAAIKIGAKTGLILCPPGVMSHWRQVMINWGLADFGDIFLFETGKDTIPKSAKFIICNYQKTIIKAVKSQLLDRKYDFIIYDEIHYLKSRTGQAVRVIYGGRNEPGLCNQAKWKWGFTATPTPNDAMEIYPTAKVHAKHLLGKYSDYESFGERYSYYWDKGGTPGYYGSRKNRMHELGKRLRPFMLVRKAEDVFTDFPEPIVEHIYVEIPFREIGCDESDTHMATLRRQIGKAKASRVTTFVRDRVNATGRKHIVFTYSREVTEQITEDLKDLGAVKIYGGMSRKRKEEVKQSFIDKDFVKVLVLQMQSAGTGIDGLQTVCYDMVIAEADWVDGTYKQIIGRLRRLFQKNKKVFVFLIIAKNTFDEIILKSRKRKGASIFLLEKSLNKRRKRMIEDLIKDLTAAIKENTAALKGSGAVAKEGKPDTEKSKNATTATGKTADSASNAVKTANAVKESDTKSQKNTKKESKATADSVKEKCSELLALYQGDLDKEDDEDEWVEATEQGRAAIAKVLKKFKAKKVDEVPKEKLGELQDALSELIEAMETEEGDDGEGEESGSEF